MEGVRYDFWEGAPFHSSLFRMFPIGKKTFYLRRAVDEDGMVLDNLLQDQRNQEAAGTFPRRVVEGQPGEPRVVVTDKPASYRPAIKRMLPRSEHHREHHRHKGLNGRAEHSHQSTWQRERRMRYCTSPEHAPPFLASFGPIDEHCTPKRQPLGAAAFRRELSGQRVLWHVIAGVVAERQQPRGLGAAVASASALPHASSSRLTRRSPGVDPRTPAVITLGGA